MESFTQNKPLRDLYSTLHKAFYAWGNFMVDNQESCLEKTDWSSVSIINSCFEYQENSHEKSCYLKNRQKDLTWCWISLLQAFEDHFQKQ